MTDNNIIESHQNEEINRFLKELTNAVRVLINDEKMINKCDACQGLIGRCLDKLQIPYFPCSTNIVISETVTGHSFIVAFMGGKLFLIDPAFIQFKYGPREDVILQNMKCISKSPYFYMKEIDSNLTDELIENGYLVLDKHSAYAYGNSFYFTKSNIPCDLELFPISGEVFIEAFKKGKDQLRDYHLGEIDIKCFETSKYLK